MTRQMPPGQLTTSELSREIAALEAGLRGVPVGSQDRHGGRLEALDAERDERCRLTGCRLRAAQEQFPGDVS